MSKRTKILSFFVLVIFLSTGIFAQGFYGNHHKAFTKNMRARFMSPMRLYRMLSLYKDKLNVTDDQLTKLKSLAFYIEEKQVKLTNANRTLRLKLREELSAENINYKVVKDIMGKISQNRSELFIERLKARDEIKKILTDEQLTKIREFILQNRKTRRPMNSQMKRRVPPFRNK